MLAGLVEFMVEFGGANTAGAFGVEGIRAPPGTGTGGGPRVKDCAVY